MEIFNAKRRDIYDFDSYMDLKKPGFGGPMSAVKYKDGKGNLVNNKPKLKEYQRQVERHPLFNHQVYDPTYKAMTHDLVYKQSKKKPFTYRDPYLTGLPVVDMTKMQEGKAVQSFESFINENEYLDDIQLTIRLIYPGQIPSHKKIMLEKLSKYPGSLVELKGDEDELEFAKDLYQVNCDEIENQEGGTSLVCKAEDLLTALNVIEQQNRSK